MDEQTERILRLANSYVYAMFGFGAEPFEFAKRIFELREANPSNSNLIFDIANRISFINFLRFQVGWKSETMHNTGEHFRVSDNLDALETYLLCTCIDTLGGGRESVNFIEWLEENSQLAHSILPSEPLSFQDFASVNKQLYALYQESNEGLTRNFLSLFQTLPDFLQDKIVDSFVLIDGDYLSEEAPNRFQRWLELPKAKKMKRFAIDYLYAVRRSKYTHSSSIYESILPGRWRRDIDRGRLPADFFSEGWRHTAIRSTKKPEKIKFTLLSRGSLDENFILRAAITTHILTRYLKYSVSEEYLEKLLRQYDALSSLSAFLNEMEKNRDTVNYLTSVQALESDGRIEYYGIPTLTTSAGERLLEIFDDVITHMKQDIDHYLHWVRELNDEIRFGNDSVEKNKSDWIELRKTLIDFSQGFAQNPYIGQFLWNHNWVYSNLVRHIQQGHIHYQFTKLLNA